MVDLPTFSRQDLRDSAPGKGDEIYGGPSKRVPFAKSALTDAIAREAALQALTGEGTGGEGLLDSMERYIRQRAGGPSVQDGRELGILINKEFEQSHRSLEARRRDVSFGQQVGAAWDLYTGTQAIIDWIGRDRFEPDPDFSYWDHQKEIEEGMTYEENRWIRNNAVSLESAQALRAEALERREKEFMLSARGTGSALLASLVGGAADPVGWAAGFGVGKALQLGGVGSRALYASGRLPGAMASIAAEGAAANVAIEAVLDAAGRRVDAPDYAIAAAFGAGFGVATAPLAFRGARSEAAQAAVRALREQAEEQRAELYARAAHNLGPGASADDIAAEVGRLQQVEWQRLEEIRLAMPPDEDRLLPRGEVTDGSMAQAPDDILRNAEDAAEARASSARLRVAEDQAAVAAARRANDPDALLRAEEDLQESLATYRRETGEARLEPTIGQESFIAGRAEATPYERSIGVDGMLLTDPARAKMLSEIHQRSDNWAHNNPIDERRIQDFLGRISWAPKLASTAQQLMRSQHPVARMIAGTLLENTTGAAGRRATAALDKAMYERQYLGMLSNVPDVYRAWRQSNGGSGIKDWINRDQMHREFNYLVSEYRLRRAYGADVEDANPFVRQAAEMYDKFYDQVRRDQVRVGTPGHEALPSSSTGYFPRRIRADWVQAASGAKLRALRAEYKRQLTQLWDDPDFADQISAQIVEHARIQAAGGNEIPANLYTGSAAPMVRNALESVGRGQLKMTHPEIEEMMRRLSTGGPSFTKSRVDLDMMAEIRDPETGEAFRLMDVYETDQLKLALSYGRRVSGEVALSKYGVPGEKGLDMLRDALTVGRDGQRLSGKALDDTLQAFDQIAAEFLGKPFRGQKTVAGLDNLRMLTAASRLGGMAFTQLGEYANALPALGATAALRAVKDLPRIIEDVRLGRKDPILDSVELIGGEIGTDWRVNFPFQQMDDTYVHGQESLGAFSKVVRATSNAIPHINGWHYVHAAQVRGMAQQIIHKATRIINAVEVPKGKQLEMLEDMGFTPELRAAWKRDMSRVAKFDGQGNLVEFDVLGFRDPKVAHDIVQAINRGSKQIIQGSYIGERGLWAHDNLLRMLTQFRTFSLVSMEKQWTRVAAIRGGIQTFGFLLGALSWALPIHIARTYINSIGRSDREEYLENSFSTFNLGRAVMNYASLSGFASDMLDLGATAVVMTEGITGLDSGLELSGVRGISGGRIEDLIPSLGYAGSVFRNVTQGNVENLLRDLPGGNVPWAVPLINAITAKGDDPNWDSSDL